MARQGLCSNILSCPSRGHATGSWECQWRGILLLIESTSNYFLHLLSPENHLWMDVWFRGFFWSWGNNSSVCQTVGWRCNCVPLWYWHLDQDVNGAPRNCSAGLAMTKKKPMTVLLMGTYYALGIFCVHCVWSSKELLFHCNMETKTQTGWCIDRIHSM